jgi:hypothetical protein
VVISSLSAIADLAFCREKAFRKERLIQKGQLSTFPKTSSSGRRNRFGSDQMPSQKTVLVRERLCIPHSSKHVAC